MADLKGVNPVLASKIQQIMAQCPSVTVTSGYRSDEAQAALYNRWIDGKYDVPAVAKPQSLGGAGSNHTHGTAVDLGGDLACASKIGAQLGLVTPVSGEPWHFELGDGAELPDDMGGGTFDTQYNLPADSPEEVLANRLHSVLSIIGSDHVGQSNGLGGQFAPEGPMQEGSSTTTVTFPEGSIDARQLGGGGGAYNKEAYKQYALSLFPQFGWSPDQFDELDKLVMSESGWNPGAQNPHSTAYGIGQFLNGTWAGTGFEKTSDPYQQIKAMLTYIKHRKEYGDPARAWQFKIRNNWY